ncbi:thiol:disulfide interchange protein DsbA/DsbL [Pseudoduganella aquatica]|uniref:Thiol:disulfide interchange protein n=1 Tax=Pseudoduganella aquatica TaxID=2660641 RepID=A0A7X4KLQ8_9BURK|nr:thiol:disulfide interchange protein DsbA/DsbL [Pseudoduganella aquatica]MYN07377.1 thioredoxin domain-containing protein [Pseudoduganella aquatica]
MRILKQLLSVVAMCSAAFGAAASPAAPISGVEYQTLQTAQPTDTGKKIEVIEFFAYYCPHCNNLEPQLEAWVKKQGDNIVFKRVHVPRDESVLPQQKLFFTLEAMGLLPQYHKKVFNAMHVERNRLNRDEQVFDWVAANGIDRQKFIDTYRSFGVQAKVKRADGMMDSYKIDSWPTLIVDGRYQASPHLAASGMQGNPSETELQTAALQVMDFLVAKAKAEKK